MGWENFLQHAVQMKLSYQLWMISDIQQKAKEHFYDNIITHLNKTWISFTWNWEHLKTEFEGKKCYYEIKQATSGE